MVEKTTTKTFLGKAAILAAILEDDRVPITIAIEPPLRNVHD